MIATMAGAPISIEHVGHGYVLNPGADVDLWRLEAALKGGHQEELAVLRQSLSDGATRRAALGSWFAPFEAQLAQRLKELDRFLIRTESAEIDQMGTPHSARMR